MELLGGVSHLGTTRGSFVPCKTSVTCKTVQVVGLLRTYQPYSREGWSSHNQDIRLGDVILWHSRGIRTRGAEQFLPEFKLI
jgi:hypothetical protein